MFRLDTSLAISSKRYSDHLLGGPDGWYYCMDFNLRLVDKLWLVGFGTQSTEALTIRGFSINWIDTEEEVGIMSPTNNVFNKMYNGIKNENLPY